MVKTSIAEGSSVNIEYDEANSTLIITNSPSGGNVIGMAYDETTETIVVSLKSESATTVQETEGS